MTTNVGTIDRVGRIIVGIALIAFALGYIAPGTSWAWVGWHTTITIWRMHGSILTTHFRPQAAPSPALRPRAGAGADLRSRSRSRSTGRV